MITVHRTRTLRPGVRSALPLIIAACLLASGLTATARAQNGRGGVSGVTNFGRVTDTYFRGGKVTPEGIKNLYDMGVRTVVDLAGKGGDEEATCKSLGITWYSFPMNGSSRPDDTKVDEILSIIKNAKEPVYVHCSAGKHRAGTICALYRMRVQGWTPEKAWNEQQSYGFGEPSGHAELYAYVYGGGDGERTKDTQIAAVDDESDSRTVLTRRDENESTVDQMRVSDDSSDSSKKSSKKSKKKHDDDDHESSKKSKKKHDDDDE